MSPKTTESDALTIARWCWPERAWSKKGESYPPGAGCGIYFNDDLYEDPEGALCVADAERILIERGHAEAYGRALVKEIRWDGPELPAGSTEGAIRFGWYANIATAPLEARVRAMAAVIRALAPEPRT